MIGVDQELFHIINSEWTNPFFDGVLPLLRDKMTWIPVYVFIVSFFLVNYRSKAYFIILFLIVSVGISDMVSSKFIKPTIERIRPCNDDDLIQKRVLVRCGSGYSFTSSHASNHFALSFFLIFLLYDHKKWIKFLLLFWAISVSYAQVYVGVHYPLDVISGGLLGFVIAAISFNFYRKYFHRSFA